jgi:hypothetical protein
VTLSDIAAVMGVDYAEAALLLAYEARPARLIGYRHPPLRHSLRHEHADSLRGQVDTSGHPVPHFDSTAAVQSRSR